jgi:lipopolysaccharide/colanic/teichoic acid biosynthesis glycosyltransferase
LLLTGRAYTAPQIMSGSKPAHSFYRRFGKRLFDAVVAAVALVVLGVIIGIVGVLVARKLGRPVLFRQQRSGLHGRPFRLAKFRSMTDGRDAEGRPLPDEVRLTPFGRRLRSTSLDELPSLWNVLKGEMSLVGPRPLHCSYDERYSPTQKRRLEVRPGITGWAQVNGRNALGWNDKFMLDVWYVDHQSFWLDLEIIFRTVAAVFGARGIAAEGAATMPEFKGEAEPGERS